jgi:hypothetical protein
MKALKEQMEVNLKVIKANREDCIYSERDSSLPLLRLTSTDFKHRLVKAPQYSRVAAIGGQGLFIILLITCWVGFGNEDAGNGLGGGLINISSVSIILDGGGGHSAFWWVFGDLIISTGANGGEGRLDLQLALQLLIQYLLLQLSRFSRTTHFGLL